MKKKGSKNMTIYFPIFEGKIYCLLLFFLAQNFYTQLTIAEGAIVYSDKAAIYQQEGTVNIEKDTNICITPDAEISDSVSKVDFDVREINSYKKHENLLEKKAGSKIAKVDIEPHIEQNNIPNNRDASKKQKIIFNKPVFSISKSKAYFLSFTGSLFQNAVSSSQFDGKCIIKLKENYSSFIFGITKMILKYFKNTKFLVTEFTSYFSVRPPPIIS